MNMPLIQRLSALHAYYEADSEIAAAVAAIVRDLATGKITKGTAAKAKKAVELAGSDSAAGREIIQAVPEAGD